MAPPRKLPNGFETTGFHSVLCPHCEDFMASARSEQALYEGLLEHVDAKHPEEGQLSRLAVQ